MSPQPSPQFPAPNPCLGCQTHPWHLEPPCAASRGWEGSAGPSPERVKSGWRHRAPRLSPFPSCEALGVRRRLVSFWMLPAVAPGLGGRRSPNALSTRLEPASCCPRCLGQLCSGAAGEADVFCARRVTFPLHCPSHTESRATPAAGPSTPEMLRGVSRACPKVLVLLIGNVLRLQWR